MKDFETAAIIAEQAQSEIDGLTFAKNNLVKLLKEADDMWAFSSANQTRGHYDVAWNQRRIELLEQLGESRK